LIISLDSPDPLRVTEILIIIGVLLLWCISILAFIRHSELLRIRHRDLPYRPSLKGPMNLNHITVVNRTSDMIIHSKPRSAAAPVLINAPVENAPSAEFDAIRRHSSIAYSWPNERQGQSFDSSASAARHLDNDDQLLDPHMISSDVRRHLLDLHRKSMDNLQALRHSISYSSNDVSKPPTITETHLTVDERCVQESPV
jgi:hypothetical protein